MREFEPVLNRIGHMRRCFQATEVLQNFVFLVGIMALLALAVTLDLCGTGYETISVERARCKTCLCLEAVIIVLTSVFIAHYCRQLFCQFTRLIGLELRQCSG
jgi:hypothetical protein